MITEYQIQDAAKNTAVVKLIRDDDGAVLAWQTLTPGAFAPGIQIATDKPAHRSEGGVHSPMLSCDNTYETGEDIGCFAMYTFFIGGTSRSLPGGVGRIFEKGVLEGKLQPGPMVWIQLFPE